MSKKNVKVKSSNGPVVALVIGAIAVIGLMIYAAISSSQNRGMDQPIQPGCTSSKVTSQIPGVERVPCKSQTHVPDGQKVTYDTDPPLSGAHYAGPTPPGFYTFAQTNERIVHSLEHGNVVIYYNKAKLSDAELDAIRKLATTYKGTWDGVIATPREDSQYAVILTAWEYALRLEKFDQAKVNQFVDEFRGRGPENPVR